MTLRFLAVVSATLAASLLSTGIAGSSDGSSPFVQSLFSHQSPDAPGASVAVLQHGRISFAGGFGSADLRFHHPIDERTRFDVGSIAKQFTALLVYHLIREGHLVASARIRSIVPELPESMDDVTVQELLWQTSGIRDYIELSAMAGHMPGDAITRKDFLALMQRQKSLNFVPGTRYNYSNSNYALLAEIVQRVSGQPFAEYAASVIFRPLGMRDSLFKDDVGAVLENFASSYWPGRSQGFSEAADRSGVAGDSNLVTTPRDLMKWEANLIVRRQWPREIEMLTGQGLLANGKPTRAGLGSGIETGQFDGIGITRFDGGTAGFRATVVTFPSRGLSVAVFTNLITFAPDAQVDALARHYLGLDASAQPKSAASEPDVTPPASQLTNPSEYVGAYRSEEIDQTFWICLQNGQLVARHTFGPEVALQPASGDGFDGAFWWFSTLRFTRAGGAINGMSVSSFRAANDVVFTRVGSTCELKPAES